MTKEERAEKWFKNIPNSENINMEKKVEICNVAAKWAALIFIALVIVEFVLLSMVNNGSILNYFADSLNGMKKDLSVLQDSPFTDRGSVVEVFTDLSVWAGIRKVIESINMNAAA